MKYMGSKRFMLENGLGELICQYAQSAERVVDLFCGSGSVAWFAAEHTQRPVLAVDLQTYAVALANAVIARTFTLDPAGIAHEWLEPALASRDSSPQWSATRELEDAGGDIDALVRGARVLCSGASNAGPIWNAYGGHYFSPSQALTFDHLLACLPTQEPKRAVSIAAVLLAASRCAASPGHTAQPFQPTPTAGRYLMQAWSRDPIRFCRQALEQLCPLRASVVGEAVVGEAAVIAASLQSTDLVIVDPPYSSVQYSRFYHVLETMARGYSIGAEGVGRYPPRTDRPQSDFSKKTQSQEALRQLMVTLASAAARVIFTFPEGECSNGLSGRIIVETAETWFDIQQKTVKGRFSTLGGNNSHRASRTFSSELILVMTPK